MEVVNVHIGKRIFKRRRFLHLTQKNVAQAIGVTYQQIQKYECGATQISAARVWLLAGALGTSVSYFYEGLPSFLVRSASVHDFENRSPTSPVPGEAAESAVDGRLNLLTN